MRELVLIVEPIATNRIVLRSLFESARYRVLTCSSPREADALVESDRPDFIILSTESDMPRALAFCRKVSGVVGGSGSALPGGESGNPRIPVIGICAMARDVARLATLKAGAVDVFERPMSEGLLLARIRSILRQQKALSDLEPNARLKPALGFSEPGESFSSPRHFVVLSKRRGPLQNALGANVARPEDSIAFHDPGGDFFDDGPRRPDVIIIDATTGELAPGALMRLLADLRSHENVRHAAQMVILPSNCPDLAVSALDLGANDVVSELIGTPEMAIRLRSLLNHKEQGDTLRKQLRNGLAASVIDPLTGLYNRRAGRAQLAAIARHTGRSGRSFATMLLDIDHFKSVNDTYGHLTGDKVLRGVAETLRDLVEPHGMVARIGGEEFLIAIPDTTEKEAERLAQKIRIGISRRKHYPETATETRGTRGRGFSVTISAGVALGGPMESNEAALSDLLSRADDALYSAKAAGRDRVALTGASTAA